VINSYNKNQLDELISRVYFGIKLYMFRTVPLSIIRSSSLYTQQWYMSYRFADSLRAGSGRSSVMILLHDTIAVCTVKTPDDGSRNCPKHVEFNCKIHLRN